ncbi:spondin domain-containing protein [Kaarinaea lacus]
MKLKNVLLPLSVGLLATMSANANAAQWDVSITNLTHGSHFTPLLVTAHDSGSHLFEVGMAASGSLQAMAECGDLSGLLGTYPADADTIENPAAGLLNPGATTTTMVDTSNTSNTHLSIVGMVLPTNDAFVGLDGLQVPTAAGTYTYYLNAYDAGTEANDEVLDTSGCAAGMPGIPAGPGGDTGMSGTGVAGVDSNTMVHVHRGILGDTNPTGGASDLDSTIHRWQNPVAKVVITVTP